MSKHAIQPMPGMAYEHKDGGVWLVKELGDVMHLTDFAGASDLHINRNAFEIEFTPMGVVETHEVEGVGFLQVAQSFENEEDTHVVTLFSDEGGDAYPLSVTGGAFGPGDGSFEARKKANVRAVLSLASVDDETIKGLLGRMGN